MQEFPKGRMAPSPTGYMHLGNAWSFLMAWLSIRQQKGTMVLRMEDIDPDRAKPHYAEAIMNDLAWLGLDWDEGPSFVSTLHEVTSFTSTVSTSNTSVNTSNLPVSTSNSSIQASSANAPYIQSQCSALYIEALNYLAAAGHSYPCFCTRKELRAMAGAPHLGETCIYSGTCRNLTPQEQEKRIAQGRKSCIRLLCPDITISFTDRRCGLQQYSLTDCGGDFAIRRSDGVFAYQLAVVVDDMRMGITEIVRGDDILHCTPRQIYLQSLLQSLLQQGSISQYTQPSSRNTQQLYHPTYLHVPLLLDAEGERFAKRHASLTIKSLRESGISAQVIIGYLAFLAGFVDVYRPISAEMLIPYFDARRLPKSSLRLLHNPFETMQNLARMSGANDAINGAINGATSPKLDAAYMATYLSGHLACEPYGPVLKS